MTIKHLLALTGVLALSTSVLAQNKEQPKKEEPKKDHPEHPKKDSSGEGKGAGSPKAGEKDIVDTAMGTGMHKKLCDALKAADWVAPLKEKGPFTVFAPTDEAFGKLPPGTWDSWLKPENKAALANVLKYHVIKGAAVKSEEVMKMKESANTVQGGKITIAVKDKKVWLNGDKISVVKADVECSNGVIHVIDGVLMPKDEAKKDDHGKKDEGKKEDHGKKDEKKPEGKKDEPKKGG